MHVIDKYEEMESAPGKPKIQRRQFFLRLFGGLSVGWIAGILFSQRTRSSVAAKSNEDLQVTINSLAVPRNMKGAKKSHGAQ